MCLISILKSVVRFVSSFTVRSVMVCAPWTLEKDFILLLLGGVFYKHLVLLLEGDFLHLADFLFNSINCGESKVEVSNYNCASGSLSVLSVVCYVFRSTLVGCVHT